MEPTVSQKYTILNIYYIFGILCTVGIVLSTEYDESYEFTLVPSVSEVVQYENDSYIVSCQASNTRLRWLDQKNRWVEETKGRVHVEERGNETVLIFTSIELEDNGTWTCEAEEGNRKIAFNMVISRPINFVDTPVVQSVKESEDALIKCMVTGDPEPSISWYRDGQPINIDGKKYIRLADGLLIKRVLKNDSGEYACKAFQISSALSNVKEQTIRLNIQHKPVAPIHRESADVQYGYINGEVNVTCEAEAEPPATFRWYRNNKHLHSRHHQIINGEHISILQLYLNNSKFFGDYVCEANNSLGTLRRTITLINGTKPAPPPILTLQGLNSNTLDLNIGAKKTGDPDPMDIIGYRFEVILKEENRSNRGQWTNPRVVHKDFIDGVTYLIDNLTPNTTYYIRVASMNPAGLSDWMGPKEFRTYAKSPVETPSPSTSNMITMNSSGLLTLSSAYVLFRLSKWNCNF